MLDGLRMNVVETAPNGVVGADTIFQFHQTGNDVWAEYSGGGVVRGYLVGRMDGHSLEFRYCQLERGGTVAGGHSRCEVENSEGTIRLVEHFQWASREGGGTNVFRQLPEE